VTSPNLSRSPGLEAVAVHPPRGGHVLTPPHPEAIQLRLEPVGAFPAGQVASFVHGDRQCGAHRHRVFAGVLAHLIGAQPGLEPVLLLLRRHGGQLPGGLDLPHGGHRGVPVIGPLPHRPVEPDPGHRDVHVVGVVADHHPRVLPVPHPVRQVLADARPLPIGQRAVPHVAHHLRPRLVGVLELARPRRPVALVADRDGAGDDLPPGDQRTPIVAVLVHGVRARPVQIPRQPARVGTAGDLRDHTHHHLPSCTHRLSRTDTCEARSALRANGPWFRRVRSPRTAPPVSC